MVHMEIVVIVVYLRVRDGDQLTLEFVRTEILMLAIGARGKTKSNTGSVIGPSHGNKDYLPA